MSLIIIEFHIGTKDFCIHIYISLDQSATEVFDNFNLLRQLYRKCTYKLSLTRYAIILFSIALYRKQVVGTLRRQSVASYVRQSEQKH